MYKSLTIILFVVGVLFAQDSQKVSTTGKYAESYKLFNEIVAVGSVIVDREEKLGLEIVKVDMDLVGAQDPKKSLKEFSKGYKYVVTVAGGQSRIKEIGIKIYYISHKGESLLVAQDKEGDNVASVDFQPEVDGNYLIITEAYKMILGYETSMGYYVMSVAHN